jgi:hypothetical protein
MKLFADTKISMKNTIVPTNINIEADLAGSCGSTYKIAAHINAKTSNFIITTSGE